MLKCVCVCHLLNHNFRPTDLTVSVIEVAPVRLLSVNNGKNHWSMCVCVCVCVSVKQGSCQNRYLSDFTSSLALYPHHHPQNNTYCSRLRGIKTISNDK